MPDLFQGIEEPQGPLDAESGNKLLQEDPFQPHDGVPGKRHRKCFHSSGQKAAYALFPSGPGRGLNPL